VLAASPLDGVQQSHDPLRTAVAVGALSLPPFVEPFGPDWPPAESKFAYLINSMPRTQLLRHLFGILRGAYVGPDHTIGNTSDMVIETEGGYS
jgi:hypothetical protein